MSAAKSNPIFRNGNYLHLERLIEPLIAQALLERAAQIARGGLQSENDHLIPILSGGTGKAKFGRKLLVLDDSFFPADNAQDVPDFSR